VKKHGFKIAALLLTLAITPPFLVSAANTDPAADSALPKVGTPQNLVWSSTTHGQPEWDSVPGAGLYRLTIYKDGSLIYQSSMSGSGTGRISGISSYQEIMESGTYTFTVQAGTDGDISEVSPPYVYTKPSAVLAAPTGLKWDPAHPTVLTWNQVANADGYRVEALQDGEFYSNTSWDYEGGGKTSYDTWKEQMGPTGDYTFRVRALSRDIEVCANGPWSDEISLYREDAGVSLSGKIKAYNPNSAATVQLLQNNAVLYNTTSIAVADESGQVEQDFRFENVAPGTYALRITKSAHASYIVNNITVTDQNIDLTQSGQAQIKLMTLLTGDIDGDGFINVSDLNTVWSRANYNKPAALPANPLCDLNGDGFINVTDLNILWSRANYNKSAVAVDYNN
jgi:hypothetical protein